MGTTKKKKGLEVTSKRKVLKAKRSDFTPEQWKTVTQKEPLFPEKLAQLIEIRSKLKRKNS